MKKIDISKWKKFNISEIFITEKERNIVQVPTGAMVSKKCLKEGNIPRVTVSNYNNGITGYYAEINNINYRLFENFISVSFLGTVFYQPIKTSLDMKVHCLKPKNYNLNIYSASFLVSIIRKAITNFAYSDQLSSTVLPILTLKLPATNNNQPDWIYMEKYMKNIINNQKNKLDKLNFLCNSI